MEFRCVDTHTIDWGALQPSKPYEYRQLLKKHGPKCFLMPEGTPHDPNQPHYPICSYPEGCISCTGLEAAYKRLSVFAKTSAAYKKQAGRMENLLKRTINLALSYADKADATNQCNWAFDAAERHDVPISNQLKGVIKMARSRKMRPGECRRTKDGVKYCYIEGEGVRFQPTGGSRKGSTLKGTRGQSCKRYKSVYSPAYGHNVRRCAEFSGTGSSGGSKLSGTRGQTCQRYKMVYSPAYGKRVRRCAKFA